LLLVSRVVWPLVDEELDGGLRRRSTTHARFATRATSACLGWTALAVATDSRAVVAAGREQQHEQHRREVL
jgi:hypothetical protein